MNDKIRVLASTSIYHAINDGSVTVIPLLLPIFKIMFNLTYTQIGIFTGGGLFLELIAQFYIGSKADGKNFQTLLSLGILLIAVSMLILTLSYNFITLFLFFLFNRFSLSFFHPVGVGWISRTFKKSKLDWAMGIQSGSADIGAFIAIGTTLFLAELTYWQFPLFLWAIIGIVGLFIAVFLSKNLDQKITTIKNENDQKTFNEKITDGINLLKNIKLLAPAFMIGGSAWGITVTYLPLLLQERTELSLPMIGLIVAVWIGFGSIVSFLYGKISSYVGRKKVIIFSYLIIGITGFMLIFIYNFIAIIGLMIIFGIAVFLAYPALFSFVSEVTHETVEGKTFGIIFTLQLGGGTVLLFLGGILSDIFGIWIPFLLLGAISMILSFFLIIFYNKPYVINS